MKPNTQVSILFLSLTSVLISLGPLAAIKPVAGNDQTSISIWVRSLGSEDFKVREQASQRLIQIGLPARQALLQGVMDPDLEIRRRCRELLPAILEADRQARLSAFIADKEGKQKHDLPGWERFRKVAGEDAAARQLFVQIQKKDNGFLEDADKDPEHIGDRCGSLCAHLFQRQQMQIRTAARVSQETALAEIAPLLLVSSDARVRIPLEQRYLFLNMLYQTSAQNALRNAGSAPFKKIVLKWMQRQAQDGSDSLMIFSLINQLGMKEGLDLALDVVRDKKLKGHAMAPALVTIGKFGDKKQHRALLESFLDDKTVIGGFSFGRANGKNVEGSTQVRDAALASLVRLTNQSSKEYGFAITEVQPSLDYLLDQANCLGFSSDERRDKAFAKWKDWQASQKKK